MNEDFDAIDKTNIIPRSQRRSALASGLARSKPAASSSAASSSSSSGGRLQKKSFADDDDEEAEF